MKNHVVRSCFEETDFFHVKFSLQPLLILLAHFGIMSDGSDAHVHQYSINVDSWWIQVLYTIPKIEIWHEQLPTPLNRIMDTVLLNHVPYADEYLLLLCFFLCILAIIQTKAFSRPPPIPFKRLPKRPCLSLQFQPDDPTTVNMHQRLKNAQSSTPSKIVDTSGLSTEIMLSGSSISKSSKFNQGISKNASFIQRMDGFMSQRLFRSSQGNESSLRNTPVSLNQAAAPSSMIGNVETILWNESDDEMLEDPDIPVGDDDVFRSPTTGFPEASTEQSSYHFISDDAPFVRSIQDLPDSFAPLLSSSHMTMLTQQLTPDLIHAVQLEGEIRLRCGRHEVPFDKDMSRPQFVLDVVESNGCRISAVAMIGSDGLSNEQDIDVHRSTLSRSKPIVKHAGLVFDPPLALSNVAPTLIHFPTLFEDRNMLPMLRSMQFVRYVVNFIVSISSFLEKCLWIIESQCQIHLSNVRITPIYKGQSVNVPSDDTNPITAKSPKWRLQLAFSGHVLVFGWIPIPFISVTLPSFIIPQPHALLEYLLSS